DGADIRRRDGALAQERATDGAWADGADRGGVPLRGHAAFRRHAGDDPHRRRRRLRHRLVRRPPRLRAAARDRGPRRLGLLDGNGWARRRDGENRDWHPGGLHRVPQPRRHRQDGRGDRRDLRRPLRARPRRRLARARIRDVRLPLRPPGRPLRGGDRDHRADAARGEGRPRRPLLFRNGGGQPAARPAPQWVADPGRHDRAADAAPDRAPRRCLEHRLAQGSGGGRAAHGAGRRGLPRRWPRPGDAGPHRRRQHRDARLPRPAGRPDRGRTRTDGRDAGRLPRPRPRPLRLRPGPLHAGHDRAVRPGDRAAGRGRI
ncbi:MAG: hypothetical protein AVDCRST_MAG59-4258, partial [uncultured Thermomicrobiales bacterium]